ncbi:BatD family protein [Ravibacter arvi]|uniref:BatD family protein n=1 Tax=Ravibacter arvi TaxID=2051041 RepID=A0ABP8LX58_9BACT
MKLYRYLNFLLTFFILNLSASGQEIRVEIGETELGQGQPFELKVIVPQPAKRVEVAFPNLEGLEKGSTTRLRNNTAAGTDRHVQQEIISQQYSLRRNYLEVPASVVVVGGKQYPVPPFVLRVKAAAAEQSQAEEPAIEGVPSDQLEKEDVFLAVRVNKKKVYIREGFGLYLSLYVAKDIQVQMEFFDLDNQLDRVIKSLKPDGCWEENTWIDEIVPRPVAIRGRDYTEYRLYQSFFFPFIHKTVAFPAVSFKMNLGEKEKEIKTFFSRPVAVEVKNLPAHPRRDLVAVGSYRLSDTLSDERISVGQPFRYLFSIEGKGNITAIPAPTTIPVQTFEFYPPAVTQRLRADLNAVSGAKNFEYTLVPKQKGVFPLKGYFQWVYFDPEREVYDTLRSAKTINVSGAGGIAAETVTPVGENRLYANLEQLDSASIYRNYAGIFRIIMNVVVILALMWTLWVFRR